MDSKKIIGALSRISRKKPEDIQGHLSLASLGLSSSFGFSALKGLLAVEKNIAFPPMHGNMTVNNLIELLSGSSAGRSQDTAWSQKTPPASTVQPVGPAMQQPANMPMNFGHGIDIQDIGELPLASDYRRHEFYTANFAPSEIATSVLRSDQRAHLCGIFCAKEAAKKSHPALLHLRMIDFIVHHNPDGRPQLSLTNASLQEKKFQFMLSISHSSHFAVASCITFWSAF